MCENYLTSAHEEDILRILEDPDKDKYFSININFLELFESDTNLGNALLSDPENSLKTWNEAVFSVQNSFIKEIDKKYTLKNNVNCRIHRLPPWPHVCRTIFPGNDDADKFLQITGTVVRMSVRKLLEYQRQYICTKCKYPITVEAKYDKRNIIKQPKKCTNPEGCPGKNIITFGELDPYNCKDYQEIKVQEDLSKMGVGTVPGHMVVTLEDDLVNVCKPGENVTITGIVKRRWGEFEKGVKITVDIVLRANHIQVNNSSGLSVAVSDDMRQFFDSFWTRYRHDPLVGRNIILKSISPEIYGRQLVKLAIAIVLAGGSPNEENQISTGIDTRSESHLLLVGDPGTGKSQMLRFASKIIPRSVLTTGVGSTAAGLTVTAIMENGEWQLEAGALVMADGGICCIDEFNSMREHDRTSIHEAMEQQTISVAKAGMVCKLKTRCSILAACNPKGNIDPSQPLCVNVAMSSPLLSRFDLILLLRDIVSEENDRKLADHLLNKSCELSGEGVFWSLEKLQAYYAVIKKENPKLTADAETILSTYYQLQRKFGSRNKSRTTVRLLESLIRLSQGHAKLIYHKEVEIIDTIFAIILVDAALDHESSLFNLNIDYDLFFDNPGEVYWDLLENILGKLNLDYIYQRECEKMGVQIKTNSQNTNTSVSQHRNQTSPYFEELRTSSQNAVTSTAKGTQLLFSRRTPNQQHHGASILNKSQSPNEAGSQNVDSSSQNRSLHRSQFLFSQQSQKMKQNKCKSAVNHSDNGSISHASQSISEIIEENSNNATSTQRESRLLFSRGTAKNRKVSNTSFQDISNVSGNVTHSNQELTSTCNQSRPKFTQDKNSNQNFSIYQNNDDSFKRNKMVLNLEKIPSSKPITSENRDNFPEKTHKNPDIGESNKEGLKIGGSEKIKMKLSEIVKSNSNSPMDFDFDSCFTNMKSSTKPGGIVDKNSDTLNGDALNLGKRDEESNKEGIKIGGSEKKNMKLSEIVKSNSLMDFDFDSCFTNMKRSSNKLGRIFDKNSDTLKEDASNFSTRDEESGFGSSNRSHESSDIGDSVLEVTNVNVEKVTRTPNKEARKENCGKKGTTRTSNSPFKSKNKSKNDQEQNTSVDERDLLKNLRSVNDDFMKYNLNIDWDMENDKQLLVEPFDDEKDMESNNIVHFDGKRNDALKTDDKFVKGAKISSEIKDDGGANKHLEDTRTCCEKPKVLQKLEARKEDKSIKKPVKPSVVDLLAEFYFVPREQSEKGNREIDEDEKETKDKKKDSLFCSPSREKEISQDEENDEIDIILSPKAPKTFKNFKCKNIDESFIGGATRLETRKDAKPSLKEIVSGIDLDEEMRNLDFGSSSQNPFSRSLSNFSSKLSKRNENIESEKNCDMNVISSADVDFMRNNCSTDWNRQLTEETTDNYKREGNNLSNVDERTKGYSKNSEVLQKKGARSENQDNNMQNKLSDLNTAKENKLPRNERNIEPDIILRESAPRSTKKFKFTNKSVVNKLPSFFEDSGSFSDTKLERKKDAQPSLKKLVSNFDLDAEMRNFEFGSSARNPLGRTLSNFSSKSSNISEIVGPRKNCDSDVSNRFLSANRCREGQEGDGTFVGDKAQARTKSNAYLDSQMYSSACDLRDTNDTDLNQEIAEKHEVYDMTQNSRNQHMWNKFSFKKPDFKRMSSGSRSNSDDLQD